MAVMLSQCSAFHFPVFLSLNLSVSKSEYISLVDAKCDPFYATEYSAKHATFSAASRTTFHKAVLPTHLPTYSTTYMSTNFKPICSTN